MPCPSVYFIGIKRYTYYCKKQAPACQCTKLTFCTGQAAGFCTNCQIARRGKTISAHRGQNGAETRRQGRNGAETRRQGRNGAEMRRQGQNGAAAHRMAQQRRRQKERSAARSAAGPREHGAPSAKCRRQGRFFYGRNFSGGHRRFPLSGKYQLGGRRRVRQAVCHSARGVVRQ